MSDDVKTARDALRMAARNFTAAEKHKDLYSKACQLLDNAAISFAGAVEREKQRGPGGGFHSEDCGTKYRGCAPDCGFQTPEDIERDRKLGWHGS